MEMKNQLKWAHINKIIWIEKKKCFLDTDIYLYKEHI